MDEQTTARENFPEAGHDLNEADFRALVNGVRDYAIFMLSPDGRVVSWNSGAERIKGYRAEEIIGRHFSVFYPPEDSRERADEELRQAAETGRYEEEGWRRRKDGSVFRAYVVVSALYGPDGKLTGFTKVTQDVTARWEAEQAARQSQERFRVLVEQIRDYAIFMVDPQGRISTWNLGAQRIKGYRAEEAVGNSLSMFYTPEDRASGRLQRLLGKARRSGVAHDIGWRVRKDGSRFWADVTLTALHTPEGELSGFAKVVRDLTEQVQAEAQTRAYEAAKEAIEVRDEFLSIAAHELRTPLTALLLQLQNLQRLTARDSTQWRHERVSAGITSAVGSSQQLAELVETLLDVSRISSHRIRLSLAEFDLTQACEEAIQRLEGLTRQTGCKVRLTAPPQVRGRWDRLRIEQALMNLLSNACKYAPHTTVEVEIQADAERVVVSVADKGPGIEPEHVERVFERFERAVSSANYGGLGLGLYVTRQIVECHGGSIKVDTTPGVGSTFRLLLPRHTTETEPTG